LRDQYGEAFEGVRRALQNGASSSYRCSFLTM
jgi:hypothetical protein